MYYRDSIGERIAAQWRSILSSDPLVQCIEKRGIVAFEKYMRDGRPDVIFSSHGAANWRILTARRRTELSTVVIPWIHGPNAFKKNTRSLARYGRHRRALYHEADKFIAVSRGVAEETAADLELPMDKIAVIYNPVIDSNLDIQAIQPPDHPWFHSIDIPILLAVGRCTAQKDFATLLRAFARLREQRDARLVILGDGKLKKDLVALAHQLNIDAWVSFPGFVSNPYSFMRYASLFVLSSVLEGLPTVLIEAMACGCPVVSTDCVSGPNEILEGGRWGPLVPVGDDEALAKAMLVVLNNPIEAAALRQRAAYFTVERAADKYQQIAWQAVDS